MVYTLLRVSYFYIRILQYPLKYYLQYTILWLNVKSLIKVKWRAYQSTRAVNDTYGRHIQLGRYLHGALCLLRTTQSHANIRQNSFVFIRLQCNMAWAMLPATLSVSTNMSSKPCHCGQCCVMTRYGKLL